MTITDYTKQIRKEYGRIVLNKQEAATELNCTTAHLDKERKKGRITAIRGSYRIKFTSDEVGRYMGLVA